MYRLTKAHVKLVKVHNTNENVKVENVHVEKVKVAHEGKQLVIVRNVKVDMSM